MKTASNEEKDHRFHFMKEISDLVIDFSVAETARDFGPELANEVKDCLSLNEIRLWNAVSYYYDKLLYDYKEKNGYFDEKEERNSGHDKMAGLTAIALMTLTPIDVKAHSEKVTAVAEIAETYALFFASTVLHVNFDLPHKSINKKNAKLTKSHIIGMIVILISVFFVADILSEISRHYPKPILKPHYTCDNWVHFAFFDRCKDRLQ